MRGHKKECLCLKTGREGGVKNDERKFLLLIDDVNKKNIRKKRIDSWTFFVV